MNEKASKTVDTRMALTSADVLGERIERLRELIPEAFVEGKVDFERLKAALGEFVDEGRERYGLSWAGKADAIRNIQSSSVGTLVPCPEESINFDTTENLFIEGDNLEVLKLLQKSYYGKVKMIYIDPPYNTGNEFIYPDNYREGLEGYLRYSGQVDDAGVRLSTNTETSGRYHSNWLDMMYPRLFLARNLLRPDGIIFVSIDDHEVHDLRMLMNEVFGEENFISMIIVQSNKRGQTYKDIAKTHEYVLLYSRGEDVSLKELPKQDGALPYEDSRGQYDLWELRNRNPKFGRHNRPNLFFPIYVAPNVHEECGHAKVSLEQSDEYHVEVFPRDSNERDSCWRWSREKIVLEDLTSSTPMLVGKQKRDGGWNVYERSRKSTTKAKSLWTETDVISEQGTIELGELGLGDKFDHPKPSGLIRKCVQIATDEQDTVLDFFAGSATTAHAVFDLNLEDGGNRRFIMVQLPERIAEGCAAHDAGFSSIADIGIERIRQVIRKHTEEKTGQLPFEERSQPIDYGVRLFKLKASNFKIWDGEETPEDADALADQLKLFADHVMPGRGEQDILYELMLKAGLPLTAKIEEKDVAGQTAYSIADGLLLICLANPITQDSLRAMIELKPQRVVCLDPAFQGNDQLKTNTVLEMKSHNIEFRTV